MFASVKQIRFSPQKFASGAGYFKHAWICYTSGILGFIITFGGIIFAFLPANNIEDTWYFEFKIILGILSFLVPAFFIFRLNQRKMKLADVSAQAAEAFPD